LLLALVALAACWAARFVCLWRAEEAAVMALIEQGFQVGRRDLVSRDMDRWLRRLGIKAPTGYVTAVSYDEKADDPVISDLSMLSTFPRLERFWIEAGDGGAALSEAAQASLVGTPAFKRLQIFGVSRPTAFPDAFFERFAQCPDLEHFAVENPNLTDEGLRHLAGCPNLKTLWIPTSQVHRGLNSLSLKSLEQLHAFNTPIDSAGLEGLRGCTQLERVNLYHTAVDDSGLEILAGLPLLTFLSVDGTHVTRAGLERLLGLSELEFITATDTAVTVEDAIELTKGRVEPAIYVGTSKKRVEVYNGVVGKPDEEESP
jgi:hypothetical protein